LVPRNPAIPKLAVTLIVLASNKVLGFKRFTYPLDCSVGVLLLGMGNHDEKFLSTPTSANVGLACILLQNIGERLEHRVACIVPKRIVDPLEQIQVSCLGSA
jgi:hypothetical protein